LAKAIESDAVIIGAGAAGLMCAIEAGRRGLRVDVIEHNREVGRKILISGGGRCNFTNLRCRAENFLSANPHFAKSALARYTPADFLALVRRHGIAYHEKTRGQLFCDGPAAAIVRMLLTECADAGVRIHTGCAIRGIARGERFEVTADETTYSARSLVAAAGGLSIPKIGATDMAYRVARQFGLNLIEPRPALTPLVFDAADAARFAGLAGLACEVEARAGAGEFREKMLFTHRGLSGPAILQASSYWRPGEAAHIDLLPGVDFASELRRRKAAGESAEVRTLLAAHLPRRLAERWLELHGPSRPVREAADREMERLDAALHAWSVTPARAEGFDKAEVTAGGIDTAELSSQTMEARRAPGLYFIGEAVDVTGHLGGFNFQWAWASGAAAGRALA
jgi:predicted Rossmann fold flavoprotein